ncbi:hypothetical protein BOX15_Mlig001169g3, partial [Macrostomum lignano]
EATVASRSSINKSSILKQKSSSSANKMPMKLAILGATGPTGLLLVDQALARGHQVVAVVRSPDKLGSDRLTQPGLTVKQVPDMSAAAGEAEQKLLAEAFEGCDAVLSALGAPGSMFRIDLMTDAVPAIVAAMRSAKVSRFILLTAQCTVYRPEHPKLVEWLVKPLFIGRNLADFWRAECHLTEQCSDINFTVVKPPRLTNEPLDEQREVKAAEGQFVPEGTDRRISRANVAKFMLDCAESDEAWSKKLVAIQF